VSWTIEQRAYALAAVGLVATTGSLIVWRRSPDSRWLRPLTVFGSATAAVAVGAAIGSLPLRGPLISALAAAGVGTAAAGLTLRGRIQLYTAPLLLCGAWLVFASDALAGNPEWFTVPSGLALLTVVDLARWTRRSVGRAVATPELLALEVLGLGFLVGAALSQSLSRGPLYGLLAVALAAGVMAWGGLTRVRRRVAAGAGVSLVAVGLMLAAPIAHQLPEFRGAALWIAVAVVGAVLVVVATFLERGLARLRATARRLGELMEGWE
jgi:hypothetical protein